MMAQEPLDEASRVGDQPVGIRSETDAILEMSKRLCRLIADEAPLEDIETLLRERDERIRGVFSRPLEPNLRPHIQDWIHMIQSVDAEALLQLQKYRRRFDSSVAEIRHGLRMVARYEDAQGLGDE